MKLYIPFNSNDFNNVFSTLSISPRSFYSVRDFGFKRASPSILNPFEDVLVAFNSPIFPKKSHDAHQGYPLNIEIEANDLSKKYQKSDLLFLQDTIFLFDNFELIYRSEKERKEVEAKSLKSVETKFTKIAETRSRTLSERDKVFWIDSELTPDLFSEYTATNVKREHLQFEREINKIFGALIGFAVGSQRNLPQEFKNLYKLSKELKNRVSLFINRIGESNEKEEKQIVFRILNTIQKEVQIITPLDQTFLEKTQGQIDLAFLEKLKSLKILDQSYYDLIQKGMLELKLKETPLPLKVEKSKKVLNYRINKKYPQNYVERLDKHIKEVLFDIDRLINERIEETDFDSTSLEVDYHSDDSLDFEASQKYGKKEGLYLNQILNFFIREDTFTSVDELHESRKEFIGDLGNHLKKNVDEFSSSAERDYLMDLHKSIGNLVTPFQVDKTQLDCLKSIALLFTKGRDFMQFRELVENSSIVNKEIGYSIWGSAFGYAGLPKTLTSSIFDQKKKSEKVLSKLSEFLNENTAPLSEHVTKAKLKVPAPEASVEDYDQHHSGETTLKESLPDAPVEKKSDYTILERLLEKVHEIPRASNNQEFKDYIGKVYRDIEEDSKLGGFFNSAETRKQAFEKKIKNSLGGIKGIGVGTLEKVIDAYDDIIDGKK